MQKENTMTVGQWCGQWFIANRRKWNGNTGDGYRNLIYSHILPSIGSVVLSDLTEQTITDFYDSLQNRGLSARSVWCVHLLLRRCMDEAAREQFIPYNPVRLCQESKAEEYKAAPLRLGQLQRYLNAAEQLGVLPLIYTGLLTQFFHPLTEDPHHIPVDFQNQLYPVIGQLAVKSKGRHLPFTFLHSGAFFPHAILLLPCSLNCEQNAYNKACEHWCGCAPLLGGGLPCTNLI